MEPLNILNCLLNKSPLAGGEKLKEKVFIALLQKEEGKLLRIAWAILGTEANAWDALQETVEQAWRYRKNLRGGNAAFPSWIRRILVNQSLNMLRKDKKLILMDPTDNIFNMDREDFISEVDLDVHNVWEVVKALNNEHRQVLVLRFICDLSLKSIASELDLPLGTVKSRLNRALTKLKEKLEESDERRFSL